MLAIGNDEFEDLKPIGKYAKCPGCKKRHLVKYGDEVAKDGSKKPSKMLGYVSCGEHIYLVAIQGKELKLPRKK